MRPYFAILLLGLARFTGQGGQGRPPYSALALLGLALLTPVACASARAVSPSEGLFAKYHWIVPRSLPDGSASAFVICPRGELRLRARVDGSAGLVAYLELFVNGKFITRIDRRGAIGLADGEGMDMRSGSAWVQVSGADKVRHGLNKLTLVYRGRMGPGDREEPGPGVWRGEVELSRCRRVNMLALLAGFAQGTGWEAETYRSLQVLDGDLRSDSRDAVLDHLHDSLHRAGARAAEILDDPETRRFYGEADDVYYSRKGKRLELEGIWRQRLESLARLESFWARSRTLPLSRKLYARAESLHDRLLDAALARENLRNLFWVYSSRDHQSFTADQFESTLALGRQNLEVLGDLLEQLGKTRQSIRDAAVAAGRKGRPAGSDDIESPFGLLGQGSRSKPHEYANREGIAAAERELNLYLTLVEEFVRADLRFLKVELAFMAELIGRAPPEPSTKRRLFPVRPKWAK